MARRTQYDLYEGDGEIIGEERREDRREEREEPQRRRRPAYWETDEDDFAALPGKRPLGREEELRERDRAVRAAQPKKRYFQANEGKDDLGAPSTLFDDFDRFYQPAVPPRNVGKKKRRTKHRGAWAAVIVCCLLFLTAAGIFLIPQLTGMRYRTLPNIAFLNGSIVLLNERQEAVHKANRDAIFQETIYPGVLIDGVDVGGMTKAQACAAVAAASDMSGTKFDITVTIGNQSWQVNSERVPISRNIEETVDKAWSLGRVNTLAFRGTDLPPFEERVREASRLKSERPQFQTVKTYDHEALRTLVQGIANYVDRDPVSSMVASFDFSTKEFSFTEDQPGAKLDPDALYTKLCGLLDDENYFTSIRVTPERVPAEVSRTELMNRFGLISSYSTRTTSNKNRNTNIDLSARAINGTTVLPGETFSFNETTGERTAEKGYREAAAISGGASKDEVGGGVCQTSSTLFNAVVRADLEIVERSPHAWPSSYVEKGFDATVNWPGLDFKFKNNTEWPIFIIASYANQKVSVSVYGMSLGADMSIELESEVVRNLPQPSGVNYKINPDLRPGESKQTVKGRSGCIVETWKIYLQGGREIRREKLFTSTYKAYQETIEYNPR